MIKEDRYVVIYDAGDWIFDQETDEYMINKFGFMAHIEIGGLIQWK